jgi:hypothetical protein
MAIFYPYSQRMYILYTGIDQKKLRSISDLGVDHVPRLIFRISYESLHARTDYARHSIDLCIAPEFIPIDGIFRFRILERFNRDIHADLVSEFETIRNRFFHASDFYGNTLDDMLRNAIGPCVWAETRDLDCRVIDMRSPGFILEGDPYVRGSLSGKPVKTKSR